MKELILAIIILIFATTLPAQDVQITKGTEFTPSKVKIWNGYIGTDKSGFYVLRKVIKNNEVDFFIEKFDSKTLKKVYEKDLKATGKTVTSWVINDIHSFPFCLENKIYFFYTVFENGIKNLMLRTIDTDGNLIGKPQEIASMKSDNMGVQGRNFYVELSPNKSKLIVVSEFQWPKKAQDVECSLYETNTMNKLWTKKIIDNYSNSTVNSYSYNIDNDGRLFYLFNYTIDFEENINGIGLGIINLNEENSKIIEIPFVKKEIKNGAFTFANDKLVFCGLFKDIVNRKDRKAGKEKK